MWHQKVLILTIFLCAITISCKRTKSGNRIQEPAGHDSVHTKGEPINILKYKVKEEQHQKDSLDLTFQKVILEKIAPFEYELTIDAETEPSKIPFHNKYYIILGIYPEDDKISLLASERKKYGFESFSARFEKNKSNKLIVRRRVKTKVEFARAITLTVMEYRNNRKSQVLVMQNVTF